MAVWKDQIKLIKEWGVGDLVKNDSSFPLDGTTNYNHIEALEGSDVDNHISVRRSVRNLVSNEDNMKDYFGSFLKNFTAYPNSSYVFPNSLKELEVDQTSDIFSISLSAVKF